MTQYTLYKLSFGKQTWSVMIGGQFITVIKTSLPRHMQYGKSFNNWNQVESHYKDANLKSAFLQIQSGILEPTETLITN